MTDNIKPEHYRTGEIDLFEEWYLTYPFEQYRAIMQSHAEKYLRRNKVDRVEDLDKCMETIRRLKEKEIEHDGGHEEIITKDGTVTYKNDSDKIYDQNIYSLNFLLERGYKYLARDENDELWAYDISPTKHKIDWAYDVGCEITEIRSCFFPEVKWTDDEPARIVELLATYENGGENGK